MLLGAMVWWCGLTYVVDKLRTTFDLSRIEMINRIIGSIVMIVSVLGLLSTLLGLTRNYRDIVQLGEHLHDAQEVGGSKPSVPIWSIVRVLQSGREGKRRRHMAFHVGSIPISATLGP